MLYCAPADVRKAAYPDGSGAQETGTGTVADMADDALNDAITQASGVVDANLGGSYPDGSTPPGIVKFWTRDIALYLATLTFRKNQELSADSPVRLRYQAALLGLQKTPPLVPEPVVTSDQAASKDVLPQLFPYQQVGPNSYEVY